MIRKLLSLLTVTTIGLLLCLPASAQTEPDPLPIGTAAPDFSAIAYKGGATVHLSDYRGKIVILDFWATSSTPSTDALPDDEIVASKYAGDVVFLALCVSDTPENANAWIPAHNYSFTYLLDPAGKGTGAITGEYHVSGLPISYVIGPNGTIAAGLANASEADLEKAVRSLGARTAEERATNAPDKIHAGETLVGGTVGESYAGAGSLILSATSALTRAASQTFPVPRTKVVEIASTTLVYGPDLSGAPITNLAAGTPVRVIGRDQGPGKPILARAILLSTQTSPADSGPSPVASAPLPAASPASPVASAPPPPAASAVPIRSVD